MNMELERLYFSQIILNGLVLPVAALLMVQGFHRKHRTPAFLMKSILLCWNEKLKRMTSMR